MTWLLDTNVLSEVRKGERCHPAVARWWAGVAAAELFLSVLVLGEIRKGIEGLRPRDPARATALDGWLAEVGTGFGARILPVDTAVAVGWGRLAALRPVPVVDGLMVATAMVHGLTLVSRDRGVANLGARTLDPFRDA